MTTELTIKLTTELHHLDFHTTYALLQGKQKAAACGTNKLYIGGKNLYDIAKQQHYINAVFSSSTLRSVLHCSHTISSALLNLYISLYISIGFHLNPFPDEQLILDGHRARTSLPF